MERPWPRWVTTWSAAADRGGGRLPLPPHVYRQRRRLEPTLASVLSTDGVREAVTRFLTLHDVLVVAALRRDVREPFVRRDGAAVIACEVPVRCAQDVPALLARFPSVRSLALDLTLRRPRTPEATATSVQVQTALSVGPPLVRVAFRPYVERERYLPFGVRDYAMYAAAIYRGLAQRGRLRTLELSIARHHCNAVLPSPQQLAAIAPRELVIAGTSYLYRGRVGHNREWWLGWDRLWDGLRALLHGEGGGARVRYPSIRKLELRSVDAVKLGVGAAPEGTRPYVSHAWDGVEDIEFAHGRPEYGCTVHHALPLEDLAAFPSVVDFSVRAPASEHQLYCWEEYMYSLCDDALLDSAPPHSVTALEVGPRSRLTPRGLARHAESLQSLLAHRAPHAVLAALPSLRALTEVNVEHVVLSVAVLGAVAALPRLARLRGTDLRVEAADDGERAALAFAASRVARTKEEHPFDGTQWSSADWDEGLVVWDSGSLLQREGLRLGRDGVALLGRVCLGDAADPALWAALGTFPWWTDGD
jgi:hypothetical protein